MGFFKDRYEPPDNGSMPVCPVCDRETDMFYVSKSGNVVGCERCIRAVCADSAR